MTIRTKSGSTYNFVCKNNKLYMQKGTSKGVVVSLSGLKVGARLTITYVALDMHCRETSELSTIRTSNIVSIT